MASSGPGARKKKSAKELRAQVAVSAEVSVQPSAEEYKAAAEVAGAQLEQALPEAAQEIDC